MSLFAQDAAPPGRPYWWEDVTWPDLSDEMLPDQVDLLVIGAGYTGLSAALAAHDAGARVAVIDSGQPGQGASTRNGGMLGAHPRLGWDTLAARYGVDAADGIYSEAEVALDWAKGLIQTEDIACDFEETGRIQLAYTASHFEAQKDRAVQVSEKGGVPCHIVPRADLGSEISSPLYKGGMVFASHAGLHPAKYHLGLLAAVRRRGVPVVPGCAASRVDRTKAGQLVATSRGDVKADKVVLATNGYTGAAFSWFARRVFPLPSFLIATEPLSPNLIGELAPGRRMMVETRARHSYFRISPDGTRILFGGRAAMMPIGLDKAAHRLHATMTEIWPSLAGVKLSHVWTGDTGYTFGHVPHVGEHNGLHYAMGFSGGGTVLAPWLGRKAALQALGLPGGETAYSAPRLTSRWFYRGAQPRFLHAADLWYRHVVDRRENRESRNTSR